MCGSTTLEPTHILHWLHLEPTVSASLITLTWSRLLRNRGICRRRRTSLPHSLSSTRRVRAHTLGQGMVPSRDKDAEEVSVVKTGECCEE
jgi:hypothetical protein